MVKKVLFIIVISFVFTSAAFTQVKDLNFKLTHQIIETESYVIGDDKDTLSGLQRGPDWVISMTRELQS